MIEYKVVKERIQIVRINLLFMELVLLIDIQNITFILDHASVVFWKQNITNPMQINEEIKRVKINLKMRQRTDIFG